MQVRSAFKESLNLYLSAAFPFTGIVVFLLSYKKIKIDVFLSLIIAFISVVFVSFEDGLRYEESFAQDFSWSASPIWDMLLYFSSFLMSVSMFRFLIVYV